MCARCFFVKYQTCPWLIGVKRCVCLVWWCSSLRDSMQCGSYYGNKMFFIEEPLKWWHINNICTVHCLWESSSCPGIVSTCFHSPFHFFFFPPLYPNSCIFLMSYDQAASFLALCLFEAVVLADLIWCNKRWLNNVLVVKDSRQKEVKQVRLSFHNSEAWHSVKTYSVKSTSFKSAERFVPVHAWMLYCA